MIAVILIFYRQKDKHRTIMERKQTKRIIIFLLLLLGIISVSYTHLDVYKRQAGLTIPLMATYKLNNRWNIKAGPYFSYILSREFSGHVYDCLLYTSRCV